MPAVTATQLAGMLHREQTCPIHNCIYDQFRLDANWDHWHGLCPECEQDAKYERAAEAMLRGIDFQGRALSRLSEYEAEISEKVEGEIDAYLEESRRLAAEYRPGIVANVRREFLESLAEDERAKEKEKIIADLKGAPKESEEENGDS